MAKESYAETHVCQIWTPVWKMVKNIGTLLNQEKGYQAVCRLKAVDILLTINYSVGYKQ